MPIDTNLDVAPYYDDANNAIADNYHRILFKPSVAVQARELTQVQDISQNQIERFGDNVFVAGTIVKGCNFNFDANYYYAKLLDLRPIDGQPVNPAQYVGLLAHESTSNLYAVCVNYQNGFQSQDPNLNTLYFKYINSGSNNQQQFPAGTTLQFYTNNNPVYANSVNYVSNVDVTIATTSNAVGTGYLMSVSSGIIYQKGHFIQVANNTSVIVSKYSNQPDGVVAGFNISENIISALQDSNLYDQAAGYTNYNAPGADRLQLIPSLAVYPTNATPNSNFFTLVQWDNGNISKEFQQTQYSDIGNEMARRTYEEAGNFFIKPFRIHIESSNATYNSVVASAGLAYIEGHRIEQLNNIRTPVRLGNDLKTASNQLITTGYDNSILVQQSIGIFPSTTGAIVSLMDSAQQAISNDIFAVTAYGNQIGTAKILAVEYDNGQIGTPQCQYRIYLADIRMISGQTFRNVKGIYSSSGGFADVVLNYSATSNSNVAQLSQPSKSALVFPSSKVGSFGFNSSGYLPNYTYRTSTNSLVNGSTGNSNVIQLTGSYKFPYGQGKMTSTQMADIIVVPTSFSSGGASANVTLAKTGNVSISSTTNTVVAASGNTTAFTAEYQIGDYINVANTIRCITNISNATYMSVDNNWASNSSGSHAKCYPTNVPINFISRNSIMTILDTGNQQLQLSLIASNGSSETLSSNMNIAVAYNALIPNDADRALQANTNIAVRLNVSNNAGGISGPWCLGVPYVYNIKHVYKSSNTGSFNANTTSGNTYLTTSTTGFSNGVAVFGYGLAGGTTANVVNTSTLVLSTAANANVANGNFTYGYYSNNAGDDIGFAFMLNDGQKDAFFDQSFLVQNPSYQNIGIGPSDLLTVVFDAFLPQNTGKGYISVDSYSSIIQSTGVIGYQNIPSFTDSSGNYYSLRDSIDFRPFVQNTAAYQTTVGNSVVNPVYSSTLPATENYIAAPNQSFIYNVQYYLGRVDKLMLNSYGSYSIVEGTPSETPIAPADKSDTMTLATISVPPYPSLAFTNISSNTAQSYLVNVLQSNENRVYTMKDIASLDSRITNLEYYTSLNMLEQNASSLSIQSSVTGSNRFKNGIFVDNYSTTDSLDLTNPEFRASLSPSENALIPRLALTPIGLRYSTGTNVSKTGNLVTLLNTNAGNTNLDPFMTQQFASGTRACSDNQYNFTGSISLNNPYTGIPDVVVTPPTPTPSPYTIGQLNAIVYLQQQGTNALTQIFSGYTGTGNAPAGFVQMSYMTDPVAASVLNNYFGVRLATSSNYVNWYQFTQTGYFIAPETGSYTFYAVHDDGVALGIGTNFWTYPAATSSIETTFGPINLTAGQYYSFYHNILSNSNDAFHQSILWFSVNGNVYGNYQQAKIGDGGGYVNINPTKQITTAMFARDTKPATTGTTDAAGTASTLNTQLPNQSGGLHFNIPGLNIDSNILKVPTVSVPAPAPALTTAVHVIPILRNRIFR